MKSYVADTISRGFVQVVYCRWRVEESFVSAPPAALVRHYPFHSVETRNFCFSTACKSAGTAFSVKVASGEETHLSKRS